MEANENTNLNAIANMNLESCRELLTQIFTGEVQVRNGGLWYPTPKGPRGPTAKVVPRIQACKEALLSMAQGPDGVTAKALLEASGGAFVYTDILLVAKELMASGAIQESRKGRKATWIIPA